MSFSFDPKSVDPDKGFEPLPAGFYTCRTSAMAMKRTAAGDPMLAITFEVDPAAHPQLARRQLWWNLNIGHSSEQPRTIALRQLSALCHAVGVLGEIRDDNLDDLCGHVLDVKVELVEDSQRGAKNEVKGVREFQQGRERGAAPKPKLGSFKAKDPKVRPAAVQPIGDADYGDIPF